MVQAIPEGYHALTPSFTFKDSRKAIEFYKKAFGAKLLDSFPSMDGKGVMHAVMQIGDSLFMMGDEMPGKGSARSAETLGGSAISIFIYVNDADAAFKQAVDAGATVVMPMMDQFWGDRAGALSDPFGYGWLIATHKQDLNKDQIRKNAEVFFSQMAKK